jgi:ribosomal protein S27E
MSESFIWVRCGDCEHKWVAVHLPMTIEKVSVIMRRLICPKCAKTNKIYMCEGV